MTRGGPPPGPDPSPVADPLADLLKLAQREGALEGENLVAFVTALRERADRVLLERLSRAEARLRVLETENREQSDAISALEGERAWRQETIGSLQGEKVWLRETIASLEGERTWLRETVASLEKEKAWLRDTIGNLQGEKAGLETENRGQRDAISALEGEKAGLREALGALEAQAILRRAEIEEAGEGRRKASTAHESLLTHHRELMTRVAGQMMEIASLSPLRAQEVRRRLRALADLLRADTL
jgi:chromosome segregation ATPase